MKFRKSYRKTVFIFLLLVSLGFHATAETANYSTSFEAPYCDNGDSPCKAPDSLLKSRDNIAGTVEPNSPNTIDSALDGTKGKYQKDESAENITVRNLDNRVFSSGHQVKVSTKVYCAGNRDTVNIVYTENVSSPNWTVQSSSGCNKGFNTLSTNFTTGRAEKHAFRVIVGQIQPGTTEGTGDRSDNDDLVINFDNTPPTISLNSPSNNSVIRSGKRLNFSVSDPENHFKQFKYSLDGSPNQTVSPPFIVDTWMWEEGIRNLTVYAEDYAGNIRSKRYQLKVDNTAPIIDILSPENKVYGSKNVTLDYLVTDDSFVKHYYRINRSGFSGDSAIREVYTDEKIKPESPVENLFTVHEARFNIQNGSSLAGSSFGGFQVDYGFADVNLSELDTSDFFLGVDSDQDGTVETNLTSDISSITKTNSSFTLDLGGSYSLSEDERIIASYEDIGNPSKGEYTVNLEVNSNVSKTGELEVFSSTLESKTEVERVMGAVNVTGTEGWNRLWFYSKDKAGNLNSSSVKFQIDTKKPAIKLQSPSNDTRIENGTLLDFSIKEPHLDQAKYSLNGGSNRTDFVNDFDVDTSNWSSGMNSLRIYANDSVGLRNSKKYRFNVTIGDVSPAITLNGPSNNSVIKGTGFLNFTLSDTDFYAGYYSIEGSEYSIKDFVGSYDLNLSRDQAGEFNVEIKAKDIELIRAENATPYAETRHLVNFYVKNSSTLDGESLQSVEVNYGWDADVNLSKLDSSDFFVGLDNDKDGVVETNASSDITGLSKPNNYSFQLDLGGSYSVQKGQNILVRYSDVKNPGEGTYFPDVTVNGNETKTRKLEISPSNPDETVSINSYFFTVDNTKPELKIFSPEDRKYGDKEVWLNYSVTDKNLDEVFYRLNDGSKTMLSGNTTITGEKGSNTVELIANDSAGNKNKIARNFTVDVTPPEINVKKPENKTYFQKDIVFSVSLDEEGSQCSFSVDGSSNKSMSKISTTEFEKQVLNLSYSKHTAKFWCKDVVGNINNTANISFTLKEPTLRYEPDFGSPYCASGDTPCDVNESFIISRDNLDTSEPNSPNTIDSAKDGQKGSYQKDPSVDRIYIRDQSAKTFSEGHRLKISTTAYCGGNRDVVNTVFTSNITDPSWNVKSSSTCPGSGFQTFNATFNISGTDKVAIRGLIERNGNSGTTEATSDRGDNDDVVLPLDNTPPPIKFTSHDNNSVISQNETLQFQFADPEYNFDTATFVIDNETSNRSFNGTSINASVFSEGSHTFRVYANDTAGNYNSTTYSIMVDTFKPSYRNLRQNQTLLNQSDTVKLWGEFLDSNNLSYVKLATDETGSFQNKTVYGSPQSFFSSGQWENASFNWQNSSVYGKKVNWRLWANDTAGRTVKTSTKTFKIPDSRLRVWDDSKPRQNNETILITENTRFYANYTDKKTGEPINGSNVECTAKFNGTGFSYQMGYSPEKGLYEVENKFSEEGVYSYTVYCDGSSQGYIDLEKKGTVKVEYVEANVTVKEIPSSFKASYHRNISFNTTLKCLEADCGSVKADLRYNKSSSSPDTSIGNSGEPFKVYSSNPARCSLQKGESCVINWTINVTGQIGENYVVDVKSRINETTVENRSELKSIEIGEFYLTNLTFNRVDFGVLDPGKEDKPAKKNNQSGYNISIRAYSNQPLDLWIRTTDLQSQKLDGYSIGAGNISFSTTNSVSQEKQLSNSFQNLKNGLKAGESFDSFYWIDVPYGIYNGEYRGKLYFKSNSTG